MTHHDAYLIGPPVICSARDCSNHARVLMDLRDFPEHGGGVIPFCVDCAYELSIQVGDHEMRAALEAFMDEPE